MSTTTEYAARGGDAKPPPMEVFRFLVNDCEGSLPDSSSTGRQLLAACGFLPVDEYALIRLLHGSTQSVGIDEAVELASNGLERYRAFRTDRIYLFTVNGAGYQWGEASISEGTLRQIANVPDDQTLILERAGEPDLALKAGDQVSLATVGTEHLRTIPRLQLLLTIIYNGISRPLEIRRDATVKTLLERSITLFGNLPQPHTLALWTAQGVELTNEQQTLKDAHLKDGDCLILRPSAVKGG